jgi:hypothetical protein
MDGPLGTESLPSLDHRGLEKVSGGGSRLANVGAIPHDLSYLTRWRVARLMNSREVTIFVFFQNLGNCLVVYQFEF